MPPPQLTCQPQKLPELLLHLTWQTLSGSDTTVPSSPFPSTSDISSLLPCPVLLSGEQLTVQVFPGKQAEILFASRMKQRGREFPSYVHC